jgi:CBS domain-containing protein
MQPHSKRKAAYRRNRKQEPSMHAIVDLMTRDIAVVSPEDNLQHAAQLMSDRDIGALPVLDGRQLVGILTDRDITIRAVKTGRLPADMRVAEIMSDDVLWCYQDQTVEDVLDQMAGAQVRRIPVLSRNRDLVGIVALADLAIRSGHDLRGSLEDTLEEISEPSCAVPHAAIRLHRAATDQGEGRL